MPTPEEIKRRRATASTPSAPVATPVTPAPATGVDELKAQYELKKLERAAQAEERRKQKEYQLLLQKQGILKPEEPLPEYKPYTPPVLEDFSPTLPYSFAPAPAQPVTRAIEPIGITGALRPQTKEPTGILGSFAPGAGLPAEERAKIESAYAQEVIGKRESYRKELETLGINRPTGEIKPGYEMDVEMGQVPAEAIVYRREKISPDEIEKEVKRRYPEGFVPGDVLESPVAWAARVISAPQNAAAGAIGYLLTPESIQKKKEALRAPGLRGSGIGANIAAAIASPGMSGLSEQAYDAFKLADDPRIQSLAPLAGSVGFAADVVGLGFEGPIAAISGAAKGAKEASVIAKAAGLAGKEAKGLIASRAAQSALAGGASNVIGGETVLRWINEKLPAASKLQNKLVPGDLRLQLAGRLGNDLAASEAYRVAYDDAITKAIPSRLKENPIFDAAGSVKDSIGEKVSEAIKPLDDLIDDPETIREMIQSGDEESIGYFNRELDNIAQNGRRLLSNATENPRANEALIEAFDKNIAKIKADPGSYSVDSFLSSFDADPKLSLKFRNLISATEGVIPGTERAAAHQMALDSIQDLYGDTRFFKEAKANEAIRSGLDAYANVEPEVLKGFKTVNRALANIENDLPLNRLEEVALKPYLGLAIKRNPALNDIVKEIVKNAPEEGLKGSSVTDIFELMGAYEEAEELTPRFIYEVKKQLVDDIRTIAANDVGVSIADKALADAYLRGGQNFSMLTPNTIITKDVLPQIIERYRNTKYYTDFIEPLQRGELNGDALWEATAKARTKGDITSDERDIIYDWLEREGKRPSESLLRKVTYSEIDDIARDSNLGVSINALQPVAAPEGGIINTAAQRFAIGQQRRKEEIISDVPLMLNRYKKEWNTNYISGVEAVSTDQTRAVIKEARGQISSLDKTFKYEFNAIKNSPEIAKEYGLAPDASDLQIVFAMGRGKEGQNSPEFINAIVNASIFKSKEPAISIAFKNAFSPIFKERPKFNVGQRGVNEFLKVAQQLVAVKPSEIEAVVPELFSRIEKLAATSIDIERTAKLGKVYAMKPENALNVFIGAWGEVKAKEYIANAITNATKEMQGTIPEGYLAIRESMPSRFLEYGIRSFDYKKKVSDFLYEVVKLNVKQDITNVSVSLADELDEYTKIVDRVFGATERATAMSKRRMLSVDPKNVAKDMALTFLEDDVFQDIVDQTLDAAKASGVYQSRSLESTIQNLELLQKSGIEAGRFGSPVLVKALIDELGGAPKLNELRSELGILASIGAEDTPAGRAALKLSSKIRWAFDATNSLFYNAILNYAPKFHTVNVVTGPLIAGFSIGTWSGINIPLHVNSWKILMTGSKNTPVEIRNAPVLVDALGKVWTRGELYEAAVTSGALRSQVTAELPTNFIKDMNDYVSEFGNSKWRSAEAFLGQPFAEFSDNVYRMTVIQEALKNGKTIEEALDLGRRSLYDYGDISDFERKWTSRMGFVFYNFVRNSAVTFAKNLVTNPGRILKQLRVSKGITSAMVGDQDEQNLSFYYPSEYGNSRPILALKQSMRATDSRIVLGPSLPYSDGLMLLTTFFINPKAFFIGPQKADESGRDYEAGFIFGRMGPYMKAAVLGIANNNIDLVQLKKNQVAPEHMSVLQFVPYVRNVFEYLVGPIVEVNAEPGEKNLDGKKFMLTDDGFERYKILMAAASTTGVQRTINDWTRLFIGLTAEQATGLGPQSATDVIANFTGPLTISSPQAPQTKEKWLLLSEKKKSEEEKRQLKKTRK